MSTLIITRGYPASGKTTWAREWVAQNPEGRARCNRDDLRASLYDGAGVLSHGQESLISKAQHAQVDALLCAGSDVVVDDTNLRLRYARAWADLAVAAGAEFEVRDVLVDVDECVRRDTERAEQGGRRVGETAIRSIAARFPLNRWPEVAPTAATDVAATRQYTGTPDKPRAWIVDIDGTLADHTGRDPYDTSRYHEDLPFPVIVDLVQTLHDRGDTIVVTSGRDATYRDVTALWLKQHFISHNALLMRPAGDRRKDHIVKAELFWQHIAPHYDVQGCIDDRDRVVAMWRAIGLTCLQVAPGDF